MLFGERRQYSLITNSSTSTEMGLNLQKPAALAHKLNIFRHFAEDQSFDAWYWKYIPHYRHVEDYPDEDYPRDHSEGHTKLYDEEGAVELNSLSSSSHELEITPQNYEFRDEANRKWYRIFDEYEHRFPTSVRQTKNWFRWFDKGTSTAEKKLVTKLDFLMVTFAIISYWSKNLDQSNVGNAYVSGMKEGIGMKGNDYSNTISYYNVGSVVFQTIYMYLFPRVPMHLLFFLGDVSWSVVTIATSSINTVGQLHACRFLIGATEAGYFMMIHYLLGSWYKGDELGRRGGLYYCGQMLGALTSGLLSARIYQSLDGVAGRAGWRWMFLVDGLITLPIGFLALYMVPGTPERCCSLFLSDDEIRLARKRLRDANVKTPSRDPPPFLDWALWKKILTSWPIYVLSILDGLFWNNSNNGYNGFALWLKSLGRYTIPRVNRFTSIPPALGVAFIIAVCFSADFLRSRSFAITWAVTVNFTGSLILCIWNVPEGAKWYAFYIGYFGITISSVIYGWLNDIMRHDPQARAIVLCWCNMFSNQSTAWIGRLTYPTSEGPRFKRGYTYTTIIDALLIGWVWVAFSFYKRQERKDAKINGIILYNSKTGDIPPEVARWLDADGNLKDYPNEEKKEVEVSSSIGKDDVLVKANDKVSDSE